MNDRMKDRYRVFRRGWGTYYSENLRTGKQESLRTRDKAEAYRLVAARNEVEHQPAFSLHLARVYWKAADPEASTRTWQHVMNEALKLKQGPTRERWQAAIRPAAFDPIRNLLMLETQAHHFLAVLERCSVSTNVYLRRIHNLALDLGWLPWPVVPRKRWPTLQFKAKRAINAQEHRAIIDREPNPEFRVFYELLWEIGGSQTDVATLTDENFDREKRFSPWFGPATQQEGREEFLPPYHILMPLATRYGPRCGGDNRPSHLPDHAREPPRDWLCCRTFPLKSAALHYAILTQSTRPKSAGSRPEFGTPGHSWTRCRVSPFPRRRHNGGNTSHRTAPHLMLLRC